MHKWQLLNHGHIIYFQERPSMNNRSKSKRKKIPFTASVQYCKNADTMVQCAECDKWRLVFSKKKLTQHQRKQLAEVLEDIDYTCGFMFGTWITFYCYHLHIKILVFPNIFMFLWGFFQMTSTCLSDFKYMLKITIAMIILKNCIIHVVMKRAVFIVENMFMETKMMIASIHIVTNARRIQFQKEEYSNLHILEKYCHVGHYTAFVIMLVSLQVSAGYMYTAQRSSIYIGKMLFSFGDLYT